MFRIEYSVRTESSLISIEDALIGKTEGLTPIRNVVPLIYFLSLTENLRWS